MDITRIYDSVSYNDALVSALKEAIRLSGKGIVKDGERIYAMLTDLLPGQQYETERRRVKTAYRCGSVETLLSNYASGIDTATCIDAAAQDMTTKMDISEEVAVSTMAKFAKALDMKLPVATFKPILPTSQQRSDHYEEHPPKPKKPVTINEVWPDNMSGDSGLNRKGNGASRSSTNTINSLDNSNNQSSVYAGGQKRRNKTGYVILLAIFVCCVAGIIIVKNNIMSSEDRTEITNTTSVTETDQYSVYATTSSVYTTSMTTYYDDNEWTSNYSYDEKQTTTYSDDEKRTTTYSEVEESATTTAADKSFTADTTIPITPPAVDSENIFSSGEIPPVNHNELLKTEQMLLSYIKGEGRLDKSRMVDITKLKIYGTDFVCVSAGSVSGSTVTVDMWNDDSYRADGEWFKDGNLIDISFVRYMPSLSDLTVRYSNLSDLSPLADMRKLTVLDLFYNNVTDISPLTGLTKLEMLNLGENRISDFSHISKLTALKWLALRNAGITDLSPVSGLKSLTYLFLLGNNIDDVSPIKALKNLKNLNIKDTGISDSDIRSLRSALPDCEIIS